MIIEIKIKIKIITFKKMTDIGIVVGIKWNIKIITFKMMTDIGIVVGIKWNIKIITFKKMTDIGIVVGIKWNIKIIKPPERHKLKSIRIKEIKKSKKVGSKRQLKSSDRMSN